MKSDAPRLEMACVEPCIHGFACSPGSSFRGRVYLKLDVVAFKGTRSSDVPKTAPGPSRRRLASHIDPLHRQAV